MRIVRDCDTGNLSDIGGKARNLSALRSLFRVPPFMVLTPVAEGDTTTPEGLEGLVKGYLGECTYAVRSSANVEDADDASFAGLFETRLGVTMKSLKEAVMAVIASAASDRLTAYGESKGLATGEVRMAVVIQRMIAADRAGVCITRRYPEDAVIVVEAVYGLGDLLVGGIVEPDTYLVDRRSLRPTLSRTGYQPVALQLEDGQVVQRKVPPADRSAPKLLLSEARAVAEMSIAVEQHQRYDSADVEWAYEGSLLYLLQARPYVAMHGMRTKGE